MAALRRCASSRAIDEGDLGVGLQERLGVLDHVHGRGDHRLHRRGVRHAEEDRHLAEDRAGLVGDHHAGVAAQHLDLAGDQDVELPGALALDQKGDAGVEANRRKPRPRTMLKH